MTRQSTILQPQYMNQFQCIGAECEDSCCAGWHVSIDQETYKKYNKVKDASLAPLFDKKVTRNRSNPTADNYAKIKMGPGLVCPFLGEDKLCNIQRHLGEGHLSNTCASYPRITNAVEQRLERAAVTSCPEIVRLALMNPEGISFDEVLSEPGERIISAGEPSVGKLGPHFWDIRVFAIECLQDRTYSFENRLIALGLFMNQLQALADGKRLADTPDLIARYRAILRSDVLRDELAKVPAQLSIQLKLTKELSDQRFSIKLNSRRYLDCLREYLVGLRYTKEASMEQVTENYRAVYETFYLPYMKDREYIFENYAVNYVFRRMFPLSGEDSPFGSYVMLVVHYAIIKLHLIGMSGYHQGLSDELVVKLIQSFSRVVEHSPQYIRKLYQILKDNDFLSMPYMSILIKN